MKKYNQISLFVLLFVFLVGCGDSGSDSSGDVSSVGSSDGGGISIEDIDDNDDTSDFDGTWISECFLIDDETTTNSSIIIDGENASLIDHEYDFSDCSGDGRTTSTITATISYGELVPTASSICSNSQEVDLEVDSFGILYALLCTSSDGSQLYLSDIAVSEDNRPTEINDNVSYTRQ